MTRASIIPIIDRLTPLSQIGNARAEIADAVSLWTPAPSNEPTGSRNDRRGRSEHGRQPPGQKFLLGQDGDAGRDNHQYLESGRM